MRVELTKILKSRKSIIGLIVLCIIFYSEFIEVLIANSRTDGSYLYWFEALFISGSTEGHIQQFIFFYLFALFALFIYSDKFITETRGGNYFIYFRDSKRFKRVIGFTFLFFFSLSFILLFSDFILNYISNIISENNGGEIYYMYGNPEFIDESNRSDIAVLISQHPFTSTIIYTLMSSILVSIFAVISSLLAIILKKFKEIYSIMILFNFLIFLNPYTHLHILFQPTSDSTMDKTIFSLGFHTIFFAALITVLYIVIRRKRDHV